MENSKRECFRCKIQDKIDMYGVPVLEISPNQFIFFDNASPMCIYCLDFIYINLVHFSKQSFWDHLQVCSVLYA